MCRTPPHPLDHSVLSRMKQGAFIEIVDKAAYQGRVTRPECQVSSFLELCPNYAY